MPSIEPVDAVLVQLIPSIVLPVALNVEGLVVFRILQLPEAPVRDKFEMVLLLALAVVGDPVSIITLVPVPARFVPGIPEIVLLLMFTVAALALLMIPFTSPDVADVYAILTVLSLMLMVFDAAVLPIPFSIPIHEEVVAPDWIVTLLKVMVALALVPAWAKMPLNVEPWFTPLPSLLLIVL